MPGQKRRTSLPMPVEMARRVAEMIEENSTPIPEVGCWMWMRTMSSGNYGVVTWRPWRSDRSTYFDKKPSEFLKFGNRWAGKPAHRLSLGASLGLYLTGGHVDHLCRHPWCVNPDHLEWVTPRENARRGVRSRAINKAAGVSY